MSKIYQPIVIEKTNNLIRILKESNFFDDYNLNSTDFATEYFLDKFTTKFINGTIDLELNEIFTEDEFDTYIREIISGTVCHQLIEKGLLSSYQDDDTDEVYFLTENGKKYIDDMKKNV